MKRQQLLRARATRALESYPGNVSAVVETSSGRIEVDAHSRMKSASTIKLAVLLEAYRQFDRSILNANDLVKLKPEDFTEGSGVLFHLDSVKELSIRDLLTLMIIVSDNTASNIAIRTVGMDNVNVLMRENGCTDTTLGREFMDFEAASRGLDNITSAADLVAMLKAADTGELFSEESRQHIIHTLKRQQFLANLHGRIDEDDEVAIASKSGSLPGVVNDAGIFEYRGEKVYVAVLVNDAPDNHSAQELIAEIGGYVYDWLKNKENPAEF